MSERGRIPIQLEMGVSPRINRDGHAALLSAIAAILLLSALTNCFPWLEGRLNGGLAGAFDERYCARALGSRYDLVICARSNAVSRWDGLAEAQVVHIVLAGAAPVGCRKAKGGCNDGVSHRVLYVGGQKYKSHIGGTLLFNAIGCCNATDCRPDVVAHTQVRRGCGYAGGIQVLASRIGTSAPTRSANTSESRRNYLSLARWPSGMGAACFPGPDRVNSATRTEV